MEPKLFFNLFSCIFLLILLSPFFLFLSHAKLPQSNVQNSSPLAFLKDLIGTQKGHNAKGLNELKKHLSYLGYMEHNNNSKNQTHRNDDFFDDNLELALKKYQLFFHLKANGILDDKTVENLLRPRCGVPDFVTINSSQVQNQTPTLVSHYTFFQGQPKWPITKKILTYSFPPNTRNDVMQPIMDATQQWASVAPFKFQYTTNYAQADIKISFQSRDHGDGSPFDGPGGILAHAFAPTDGRLHYDADEKWVNGAVAGEFDLETVGLHELGHILGLGHSTDGRAIMYPAIASGVRRGLWIDDIDGIRALYHN